MGEPSVKKNKRELNTFVLLLEENNVPHIVSVPVSLSTGNRTRINISENGPVSRRSNIKEKVENGGASQDDFCPDKTSGRRRLCSVRNTDCRDGESKNCLFYRGRNRVKEAARHALPSRQNQTTGKEDHRQTKGSAQHHAHYHRLHQTSAFQIDPQNKGMLDFLVPLLPVAWQLRESKIISLQEHRINLWTKRPKGTPL